MTDRQSPPLDTPRRRHAVEQTFFPVPRALVRSAFWDLHRAAHTKREAIIDLFAMVAYNDGYEYRTIHGTDVLQRGEFVASLRFLADRWRWSKNKVDRWLKGLQGAGHVTGQRTGRNGTVYLLHFIDDRAEKAVSAGEFGTASGTETMTETMTEKGQIKHEGTKERSKSPVRAQARAPKADPKLPVVEGVGVIAPSNWVALLNEDREAAGKEAISHGKLGGLLKALVAKHGFDVVRPAWQRFCADPRRASFGAGWFAENWTDYKEAAPAASSPAGPLPAKYRSTSTQENPLFRLKNNYSTTRAERVEMHQYGLIPEDRI
jgi:hypothetical protein